MMNRRTVGWIVAIALGASGAAFADNQGAEQQTQRNKTAQQESTDQERTIDQQVRDTAVGAPRRQEPEIADVPVTLKREDAGFAVERKQTESMTLEDRVEAIRLKALANAEAVKVQTKLQDLGYYKGNIDGVAGPMTRAALQRYFRDQAALAARGLLGSTALMSLGIDQSVLQRVCGLDVRP